MASLPIFSKSGITSYTFQKGPFLPHKRPIRQHQNVGVSGGNQVKVANKGSATQEIEIVLNRISLTSYNNLLTFLQDSAVNYALNTFTYTDQDANTYTVRLWNHKGLDFPLVKGGFYNIRMLLIVENL